LGIGYLDAERTTLGEDGAEEEGVKEKAVEEEMSKTEEEVAKTEEVSIPVSSIVRHIRFDQSELTTLQKSSTLHKCRERMERYGIQEETGRRQRLKLVGEWKLLLDDCRQTRADLENKGKASEQVGNRPTTELTEVLGEMRARLRNVNHVDFENAVRYFLGLSMQVASTDLLNAISTLVDLEDLAQSVGAASG
jgi:hypothetical protein